MSIFHKPGNNKNRGRKNRLVPFPLKFQISKDTGPICSSAPILIIAWLMEYTHIIKLLFVGSQDYQRA